MNTVAHPQAFPVVLAPAQAAAAAPSRKTLKAIFGLAITKLCLALLIIIWLSVLYAEDYILSLGGYLTALGVVTLLLVTGTIGLAAAKRKHKCWTVTFLVLCTLSAFFAACIFIAYSIGLALDYYDDDGYSYDYDCDDDVDYYDSGSGSWSNWRYDSPCYWDYVKTRDAKARLVYAMYGLVLICFFVEMVIAIVASAYSCHALCGCCRGEPKMRVAYIMPVQNQDYMRQLGVGLPTSGQVLGCAPGNAPDMQNKDTFPVDIGVEHGSTGSRPPSYVSLDGVREEAGQEYSKMGGVETV